jgi:hypothetical protein
MAFVSSMRCPAWACGLEALGLCSLFRAGLPTRLRTAFSHLGTSIRLHVSGTRMAPQGLLREPARGDRPACLNKQASADLSSHQLLLPPL